MSADLHISDGRPGGNLTDTICNSCPARVSRRAFCAVLYCIPHHMKCGMMLETLCLPAAKHALWPALTYNLSLLVPVNQDPQCGHDHRGCEHYQPGPAHEMNNPRQPVSKEVTDTADQADPTGGSQDVEEEEARPVHIE